MMLIEHEARVGLPRMVGGYTVILLIRQPSGVENSVRKQCATLDEAEKWLDEQMGEDE